MDLVESLLEDFRSPDLSVRFTILNRLEGVTWTSEFLREFREMAQGESDPGTKFHMSLILQTAEKNSQKALRNTLQAIEENLEGENPDYFSLGMYLKDLEPHEGPIAIDLLRQKDLSAFPEEVLPFILRSFKQYGSTQDIPAIEALCRHPNSRVLTSAIEALEKINPEDVKAFIVPMLVNGSSGVQSQAIRLLYRWDPDEALRHFEILLFSEDFSRKQSALLYGYFFPFPKIESALLRFLSLEEDSILLNRAGQLFMVNPSFETANNLTEIFEGCMGEKKRILKSVILGSIDLLSKTKIDGKKPVEILMDIIAAHRKRKAENLLKRGQTPEDEIPRESRFSILNAQDYSSQRLKIFEGFTSASAEKKIEIIELSVRFEDADVVPFFKPCLDSDSSPLVVSTIKALARLSPMEFLERAEGLLQRPQGEVLISVLESLAMVQRKWGLAILETFLFSAHTERRKVGISALEAFDFPSTRGFLLKALAREKDERLLKQIFSIAQDHLDKDLFEQIFSIQANAVHPQMEIFETALQGFAAHLIAIGSLQASDASQALLELENRMETELSRKKARSKASESPNAQKPGLMTDLSAQIHPTKGDLPGQPATDAAYSVERIESLRARAEAPPKVSISQPSSKESVIPPFLGRAGTGEPGAPQPAKPPDDDVLAGVPGSSLPERSDLLSPDAVVRFYALLRMGGGRLTPDQIAELAELSRNQPDSCTRFHMEYLIQFFESSDAKIEPSEVPGWVRLTHLLGQDEKDWKKAILILESLTRRESGFVFEVLQKFKWQGFPAEVLPHVLLFLKRFGRPSEVEGLEGFCRHEDPRVVITAIDALDKINPEDLKPHLVPLLAHENHGVRSRAVRLLYKWDIPEALKHFQSNLLSGDLDEKASTLYHAYFLPFADIEIFLLKFLSREEPQKSAKDAKIERRDEQEDFELLKKAGYLFRVNPALDIPPKLAGIWKTSSGRKKEFLHELLRGVLDALFKAKLIARDSESELSELIKQYQEKQTFDESGEKEPISVRSDRSAIASPSGRLAGYDAPDTPPSLDGRPVKAPPSLDDRPGGFFGRNPPYSLENIQKLRQEQKRKKPARSEEVRFSEFIQNLQDVRILAFALIFVFLVLGFGLFSSGGNAAKTKAEISKAPIPSRAVAGKYKVLDAGEVRDIQGTVLQTLDDGASVQLDVTGEKVFVHWTKTPRVYQSGKPFRAQIKVTKKTPDRIDVNLVRIY